MKKLALGFLLTTSFMSSAMAACPYIFDATAAQIQALPATPPAKKFPILNGQTASLTLQNASYQYYASTQKAIDESNKFLAGTSSTLKGDKILSSTGKYAIELKINNFADIPTGTYTGTQSGVTTLGYNFYGMNNAQVVYAGFLWVMNSDHAKKKQIFVTYVDLINQTEHGKQFDLPYNTANNYKVGFYLDQNSKNIGINLNGVNQGYIGTAPLGKVATEFSLQLMSMSGGYPTSLPTTFKPSMTLITDASQMTLTYPTGSKDICGNAL